MQLMSQKALSSAIAKLGKNQAAFRASVQEALLSAGFYACKDGNVGPLNDLLQAVGNSANVTAITHWMTVNLPVYVKGEKLHLSAKTYKEWGITDEASYSALGLAEGPQWHEYNKDGNRPKNVWDTGKSFEKFLSRLKTHDATLADALRKTYMAHTAASSREPLNVE